MNGGYIKHSMDTKEFIEGKNAHIDFFFNNKSKIVNPYYPTTKEWLDWQLGYDSNGSKVNENIPSIVSFW